MKNSLLVTAILSALLPSITAATSCFRDEVQIAELSAKYQPNVTFEIYRSGAEYDVSVDFPVRIEGEGFSQVTVYLSNDGMISFMAPLFAGPKGERLHTWFVVGSASASKNTLQITYGSKCGLLLEYDIPFSEARK